MEVEYQYVDGDVRPHQLTYHFGANVKEAKRLLEYHKMTYLYSSCWRIHQDIAAWLYQNVGVSDDMWNSHGGSYEINRGDHFVVDIQLRVTFKEKKHAMMFKLKWS